MARQGDPEDDLELDPPVPDDQEPEDLQDDALVKDEADEQSESDITDASAQQRGSREPDQQDQPLEQQARPSRGERRFQTLSNELQEQRRQNEALNRRIDALLAGGGQRQSQGETPEARAQRLALLTPEERITIELNDAKQGFARDLQSLRMATLDGNDRAAYQAKATVDPLYKKWSDQVEAELGTLRQQGMNVERERLMYYLIGKAAVEGRQQRGGRERQQAEQRVRRQQTRPANSGSDVQATRRRGDNLERRLEDVQL